MLEGLRHPTTTPRPRLAECVNCKSGENGVADGGCTAWCSKHGFCGHTEPYHFINCDPNVPRPATMSEDGEPEDRVAELKARVAELMFRPGTLDVVTTFYNESDGAPMPIRDDGRCGYSGWAQCNSNGGKPCCRGWPCTSSTSLCGVCGGGPEFCACPDCLDFRTSKRSDEVRWLLRGLHQHYGIWTPGTPQGLVRRIYILYNTLKGNGPPAFIDWVEDTDPARRPPPGCKDKVYTAGSGPYAGTLIALPHCVTFPTDGAPPGKDRPASQLSIYRIPGLSEVFFYIEDDMIPSGAFVASEWTDAFAR